MLRLLMPQISSSELLRIVCLAIGGAIVAGFYGVIHDQITYSISTEYFTKFKFEQFGFVQLGSERLNVCAIGFLATWWMGLLLAWFLARRQFSRPSSKTGYRKTLNGIFVVSVCSAGSSLLAFVYGIQFTPDPNTDVWSIYERRYDIVDVVSFARVAYIHNASYLGAVLGFIFAIVLIRPDTQPEVSHDLTV